MIGLTASVRNVEVITTYVARFRYFNQNKIVPVSGSNLPPFSMKFLNKEIYLFERTVFIYWDLLG